MNLEQWTDNHHKTIVDGKTKDITNVANNIFILSAKPLQQTINKSLKHDNNYNKLVIYPVGHCSVISAGMQYLSAAWGALRVNVRVLVKVVDVDVDVVVIQ